MSAAVQSFDYYHKWLGIPPAEQPPNYYRLLGIANFEADPDVIETAAEQRMAHVRARQTGKHTAASQKLLNEIAAARVQLLQPEQKKEYDAGLRDKLAAASRPETNPKLPRATVVAADSPSPIPAFAPRPAAASTPKKSGFPAQAAIALGAVGILLIVGTLVAIPFLLGQPGETTVDSQPSVPPIPATRPAPQPEPAPTAQDPPDQSPPAPPSTPAPAPASQATDNSPGEPVAEPPPPAAPVESSPPPSPEDTLVAPASEPGPPESEKTATDQNAAETRLPVPDAAALDKARQTVKDIYAAQVAAAKQPDQKAKVASEILGQAQVTLDDPAGKYVLLDTARRVGEQAGDLPLTLRACDELAKSFQINPLPLKESALDACRKLARQADDWQRLAQASQAAVDEALTAADYEAADRVAELGLECARKSRDKELITRSAARAKEVNQLAAAYAQAKDAFARLKADPQDAASHLVVGKFLCFAKRDWQAGLSHLAQGSDADLAALAKQDQDGESKSETWTELADKWLARSKSAKTSEQKAAEERAAFWYRKALPTLTGLSRVKVEKALETLPKTEISASTQAESAAEVTKTEVPAGVIDGRLLALFEDQPDFPKQLTEGEGTIRLEEQDVFSGDAALKVTPKERFASYLPGVGVKIREKPAPGEYRYLRLAWKKSGGSQIGIQLHRSDTERGKQPGEIWVRYHSGPFDKFLDSASIRVTTKPPAEWTVVTRDLYADYGEFTLTGLALTPLDGDFGLYDQMYLARELRDLNELGKLPAPRTATRGPRKRGTPSTPPRPELGLVGKWTMTYESGGVRHYEFDGKGFANFIEERRMGRLYMKGNDVVLEFDDGKLERLRLVNGMLLVEHYDPASRYPDAPTSRGQLEPSQ